MPGLMYVGKVIQDRLWRRFKLSMNLSQPDQYKFQDVIIPVTQLDELMRASKIGGGVKDISAAGGVLVTYFTVPKGKRWRLVGAYRVTTTGVSRMYIDDGSSAAFYLTAADTASVTVFPGTPLWIEETWTIGMISTNNGADTTITMRIIYEEEDSYQ